MLINLFFLNIHYKSATIEKVENYYHRNNSHRLGVLIIKPISIYLLHNFPKNI